MYLKRFRPFLFCLLATGAGLAQQLPPLPPPQQQFLPQHQTLSYGVDWRVFPAGTATFHIDSDGATQRINANGDSIGAVSLLFKVVDRFQSSFDRRTGCSQTFAKQLVEGRRQIVSTLQFQYGAHKQVLDEKNLVKATSHHQESPIPSCVTDLMSAIFVAGAQPLEVGQSFMLPIADAMRVVAVTFKPQAREEIKTAAGTFQTIRVEPTADAGVVKNRGNIWIWYSDDNRHLPVQMRARLFWGTITMRLASVEPR
jgi:Protein of unknown function (DUF3108)